MARFVLAVLASMAIIFGVDCAAPSAWTNPSVSSADGSGGCGSLAEDAAAAATGITVAGTGASAYAIIGQGTTGAITIDASTGVLTVATNVFDFETSTTYLLTITGSDGSAPSGTVTCTLTITNANDAPTWSQFGYCASASTGSTEGTVITTMSVTDQDTADTHTYAITAGNTNTDFAIAASTGVITVASGQTLDSATTAGYFLTITGADAAATATTTLLIHFGSSGAIKVACTGLLAILATMLALVMT